MAIDDTAGSDGSHSSSNRSSNRTSPHVVLDFCVDKRDTLAQLFGDLRKAEPIFDPLLSRFGGAPCGASLLGCCHAILRWPWNPLPDLRASFTFGRCSVWPGGPLLSPLRHRIPVTARFNLNHTRRPGQG